jgi:hypothetical protein
MESDVDSAARATPDPRFRKIDTTTAIEPPRAREVFDAEPVFDSDSDSISDRMDVNSSDPSQ